jgi:hypothetical protein
MGFGETNASIPPFINVCGGGMLSISAAGLWGHTPTPNSGPDGYDNYDPTHDEYLEVGGISRVIAPLNTLVGVFLTDDPPDPGAVPVDLVLGDDDMTTPQLQQAFVIGSELLGVEVPVGATRLFWGLNDGYEWSNNSGEMCVYVTIDCCPVQLTSLTAAPGLLAVGTPVQFTGTFVDGCLPVDADWDFGDECYGAQLDASSPVTTTHVYADPGVYEVILTVVDDRGNTDSGTVMVVVYDPSGGFVTGGGWIESPPGAYLPDASLVGKANFGFVSKYKKGASVPTGQTEFLFKAGDLNFHSSTYDWLVLTGSDYARFKGTGTINGSGEYKFMLWAGDGEPDTFRIKIWEEDELGVETVVYDNGMDQAIGGGNIVVHAK